MKKLIENTFAIDDLVKKMRKRSLALSLALALIFPLSSFAVESLKQSVESDRLDIKAERSTDLYVEPNFNFQTYHSILVDIFVNDAQSRPLNEALLSISSIPYEVNDLSDELIVQKSLLSYVRTDGFGRVYQAIEVSNSVKKLLIELNIQGPNNKIIVDVTDKEQINLVFTSE